MCANLAGACPLDPASPGVEEMRTRRLSALCVLLGIACAGPALAHLPHDPMAAIALAPVADGTRVVAQYLYPGRPILLVSEDTGRSWGYLAPPGMTHEVLDLRFATDDVLVAADEFTDHLFISEDGGWNWLPSTSPDGQPLACFAVSPDYATEPTLFAGTAAGLYRSDDAGVSWGSVDGLPVGELHAIVLAPGFPVDPTLYVIAGGGDIHRSSDGGDSWDIVLVTQPLIQPKVIAIAPDFDFDRMWVGNEGGSILLSEDRGDSWAQIIPQIGQVPLEEPINDLVALSATHLLGISTDHAVLCSYNGGTTWYQCNEGVAPLVTQASKLWGHYSMLRASGEDLDPVGYSAYEGIYLSLDQGLTWSERCTVLPTYVRAMHVSPGYPYDDPSIFLGTYGSGLLVTPDGAETFEWLADEQMHLYTEWMAVAPDYPEDPRLFAVLSRQMKRSEDGGASWDDVETPIEDHLAQIHLAPDFLSSGVAYALGTDAEVRWMIVRSEDGGLTWTQAYLDPIIDGPQIAFFTFSPTQDGVIYGQRSRQEAVVRSADGAESWEVLFEPPDGEKPKALFAVESGGEDIVTLVTGGGRVWRRVGDGAWLEQPPVGADVHKGLQVGSQLTDPLGDPGSALYVSLEPPGIARSRDAGASWEILPTPFRGTVLALAAPPREPNDPLLVAATHYGAFYTCDDGENWHLLDRALRHENYSCSARHQGEGWEYVLGEGTGVITSVSSTSGDAIEVEFWGRGVRWLAARGPNRGPASVSIDGEAVADVDLYDAVAGETEVVFEHSFADDDHHTLRVEVLGGGVVELDAVEVIRHRLENAPEEVYEAADWCTDLTPPTDDDDDTTPTDDDDDTTPPDDDDDTTGDDDSTEPTPDGCCAESCRQDRGGRPAAAIPALLAALLALRAARRRP